MRFSRVLFYLFLCFFSSFSAQQEPLISNFWNIQSYYLPATTGLENEREAVILARDQWIGMTGQPRTLLAQYQQQLAKINSGIGLTLLADKIGFNHNQTAKIYLFSLKALKIIKWFFTVVTLVVCFTSRAAELAYHPGIS